MKRLLILCLTFMIATELEVDGSLKVTGDIDASGNAIKNVGPPTALTDAINGNALQDALRDDTEYEYKIYLTRQAYDYNDIGIKYLERSADEQNWSNNFIPNVLVTLLDDDWIIDRTIDYGAHSQYGGRIQVIIFKRPLEDEE